MGKGILQLALEFMRFGCFTFGGGWSIVAQMQQLYVEKKNTITAQELMDLTSVAKSLPGAMVANVAMLYGYRTAGLAGGVAAVLGLCLPPMGILIAISFFTRRSEATIGSPPSWRACRRRWYPSSPRRRWDW